MFKRQQPTSSAVVEATHDLDEFATTVVKVALAELEVTGVLVPFVLLERHDRVSNHPMASGPVDGAGLIALLDVARLGMRSIGRDVLRYAIAWPGKVVDNGEVDAVFVEMAAQGHPVGAVVTICYWTDPVDRELTTDLRIRRVGPAPVRPAWN